MRRAANGTSSISAPAWWAAIASASTPSISPIAPSSWAMRRRSSWRAGASTTAWAAISPGASPMPQRRRVWPRGLVLGLTFKENLPDLRNSKVVDLIRGLQARGHDVAVHDPRADAAEAKTAYDIALLGDLFAVPDGGYDCLIGAVAHEQYREFTEADLARLVKPGGLIADIKAIWRGRRLPEGRQYWQL